MVNIEGGLRFERGGQTYRAYEDRNVNGAADENEYLGYRELLLKSVANDIPPGQSGVITGPADAPLGTVLNTADGDFTEVRFTNGAETFTAEEMGLSQLNLEQNQAQFTDGTVVQTGTDGSAVRTDIWNTVADTLARLKEELKANSS